MGSDYVVATYHVSGNELSASKVEKQALTMVCNAGPGERELHLLKFS
jgi:hypothetical protein